MKVDLSKMAMTNVHPLPSGELAVRPGTRLIHEPSSTERFVGGFSVLNPNVSGEVWHYLFDMLPGTGLRLHIVDDNFEIFQTLNIGSTVIPRAISYGIVQGEIMIGSPDMPTLWGLVGSGVKLASKVASENTSTTAIAVPRGLVLSWVNTRIVIANGSNYWVSDPVTGVEGSPRTFVGFGQSSMPGQIFGAHEGAGGMLVFCTDAGVYGLDATASDVGNVTAGWRLLSHHQTLSYDSTAVCKGRIYGLTKTGFAPIDTETNAETSLQEQPGPRARVSRVYQPDFRACRMYSGERGPYIASVDPSLTSWAIADRVCVTDLSLDHHSWWTLAPLDEFLQEDFRLRGVLRGSDDEEMLLCEHGVLRVVGNHDSRQGLNANTASPYGHFAGRIAFDPDVSPKARRIFWGASNGGYGSVKIAVRGVEKSATPLASTEGLVAGTSSWGAAGAIWSTAPINVQRQDFAVRTDDLFVEFAANGCLARVSPKAEIEISNSAPARGVNVGGS